MPVKIKQNEKYIEDNLALFVNLLRQEGLPIGTTEMIDALRSLERIDISRREDFKAALRATLVKSRRDQVLFNRVFANFFAPPEIRRQKTKEAAEKQEQYDRQLKQANRELQFKGEALQLNREELRQYSSLSPEQRDRLQEFLHKTETGVNVEPRFRPLLETVVKSHLRYCRSQENNKHSRAEGGTNVGSGAGTGSGDDSLRELDIQSIRTADLSAAEQMLQRLSKKLAVQILRRRRSGPRSGPLDLRRSMRDNMRYGGIIFDLKHKPKRRSKQQVLLVCDVSASMKRYSTFVIHFLYGLREAVRGLSCFSFSDKLENLTEEIKGRSSLQSLLDRVIRRSQNWGGGTNLGAALEDLRHKYPGTLNARTTVIVVSDTKTVALGSALKELQKLKDRVKRVIWLNPMPIEQWPDYRSVGLIGEKVEMWPCSTIAQLEKVLAGRL